MRERFAGSRNRPPTRKCSARLKSLARPFPFVRVDFYSVGGRPVFGELTFTPHGCIDNDMTDEAQFTMGRLLKLPEKLL